MSTMTTTKTGKGTTLLLIAALVALLTVPLLLNAGSEFGGSDNAGGEAIQELNPGFERWASPVWEPPGPEIQSMLFSLQGWGVLTLLHDGAALLSLFLVIVHVYCGLRPEKRHYIESMLRGQVSRAALGRDHDLELGGHAGPEAQVAALSDDIAYNNHDIDDGLRAGLFEPLGLPDKLVDAVGVLALELQELEDFVERMVDVFGRRLVLALDDSICSTQSNAHDSSG